MAKDGRKQRGDRQQQPRGERSALQVNHFQELRGMRIGPECLKCRQPITNLYNRRAGYGTERRSPAGDQRQGYLHDQCEIASAEDLRNKGLVLVAEPWTEGEGFDLVALGVDPATLAGEAVAP